MSGTRDLPIAVGENADDVVTTAFGLGHDVLVVVGDTEALLDVWAP